MTKVLSQLYSRNSGFDEFPPIYLVAHGVGALVLMNFLLGLIELPSDVFEKIKGVGLFAPFFEWKKADEMFASAKASNASFKSLNFLDSDNSFNFSTTFEEKVNPDTIPNY